MKNYRRIFTVAFIIIIALSLSIGVFAAAPEAAEAAQAADEGGLSLGGKAVGAGIAIGLAACGGGVGMGLAIAKSAEGISRQPEAEGKIRTTMMLGLVFIETAVLYALIIAILLIFVL